MAGRPHHAVAARGLGIPRVEGERARGQQRHHLFGLGRRSAGVAGLRAIHRGEQQSAHHAAQVGDARLVDFGQRFQRQAAQVEVGASLGVILEAVGFGGAQGGACLLIQKRVRCSEGGGHVGPPKTEP